MNWKRSLHLGGRLPNGKIVVGGLCGSRYFQRSSWRSRWRRSREAPHGSIEAQARIASLGGEASSLASLSSILAREASSCPWGAWLQKTGLLTTQSRPISLALSTIQITS